MLVMNAGEHATFIVEAYYECLKELMSALLAVDGFRCPDHKCLILYLRKSYPQFRESDIEFIDELRVIRHRIAYEGFSVKTEYLARRRHVADALLAELQDIVETKLSLSDQL